MNRPTASGSSTALCLLLLTALALTGCGSSWRGLVREPTPPRVNCNAGPASEIPPIPADPVEEAVWIVRVLGLYEAEVTKRRLEHQCLDELRANNVIR